MQPLFSQLVWLGAHTATEPSDLLQCAKRISLFEAREAACLALQQKLPHEHIEVIQALLTVEKQTTHFTEYNLAEFSATQPATGLHQLFPGLKALNTTPQTSTAVCDAISELALSDDNNLLIVDIVDSSLALLTAIGESNQLESFSAIYVQTANDPLYKGAATTTDIIAFLQTQGYILQQTIGNDPDLPWLSFSLNPLWNTLQQTQENNNALSAELIQTKLQLSAAQQEVIVNKKHVEQVKAEHAQQMESIYAQLNASKQELSKQEARINEITTALTAANKTKQDAEQQLTISKQQLTKDSFKNEIENFQKTEKEQVKEITKLRADLEKVSKHASTRADKIAQLEKAHRELNEANQQLQNRQQVLQQELLKAEAQIDIIKELLLKH